jgi:hypothetical protein
MMGWESREWYEIPRLAVRSTLSLYNLLIWHHGAQIRGYIEEAGL